jgi:hypothetical protein
MDSVYKSKASVEPYCNSQAVNLETDSVLLVGIRLVFLGIYQTDTRGKLGRYISVLLFWREPLFL